jgi:hypothetical protein
MIFWENYRYTNDTNIMMFWENSLGIQIKVK